MWQMFSEGNKAEKEKSGFSHFTYMFFKLYNQEIFLFKYNHHMIKPQKVSQINIQYKIYRTLVRCDTISCIECLTKILFVA